MRSHKCDQLKSLGFPIGTISELKAKAESNRIATPTTILASSGDSTPLISSTPCSSKSRITHQLTLEKLREAAGHLDTKANDTERKNMFHFVCDKLVDVSSMRKIFDVIRRKRCIMELVLLGVVLVVVHSFLALCKREKRHLLQDASFLTRPYGKNAFTFNFYQKASEWTAPSILPLIHVKTLHLKHKSRNFRCIFRDKEELVPIQKLRQKKKGHLTETAPDNYDSSGSDFHPEETEEHSDDSCAKEAPIGGKIRCSLGASQRDLLIKSLQSHRNHEPTDDEKRALELFCYVKHGVTKKDVIATVKKAGINFKDPQIMIRLYNKIKFSCCTYLREF